MTTYTLAIEHPANGRREAKAYSTPANAIDDLEGLREGGALISAIFRNGVLIDEGMLRNDEEIGEPLDAP